MNRHIDENPAARRQEVHRPREQLQWIQPHRLNQVRIPDQPAANFLHRVSIGRIEPAHETQLENQVRMRLNDFRRAEAFVNRHAQRLFAENMLPRLQRPRQLRTMHPRSRKIATASKFPRSIISS